MNVYIEQDGVLYRTPVSPNAVQAALDYWNHALDNILTASAIPSIPKVQENKFLSLFLDTWAEYDVVDVEYTRTYSRIIVKYDRNTNRFTMTVVEADEPAIQEEPKPAPQIAGTGGLDDGAVMGQDAPASAPTPTTQDEQGDMAVIRQALTDLTRRIAALENTQ